MSRAIAWRCCAELCWVMFGDHRVGRHVWRAVDWRAQRAELAATLRRFRRSA